MISVFATCTCAINVNKYMYVHTFTKRINQKCVSILSGQFHSGANNQ